MHQARPLTCFACRPPLPQAEAVVSTGHVLNYLDSRDAVAEALHQVARAVRPGGFVAMDILREHGIDAVQRVAFGEETLPEGLVVIAGARR
jgi:hypothetical protein